jgi:hypothetical protein
VTGTPSASYLRRLTTRFPAAHAHLNAVRETLHHSPQPAGDRPRTHAVTPPAILHRALLVFAALATVLVVAAPAAAAKSCGRAVIDDWYDDGRVDGTYALHCYDDAIDSLPRDVRDYSSAKEDIQRALQARLRGEDAPPARTDPTPGSPDDPDAPVSNGPDEPGETTGTPPGGGDDPGGPEAAPPVDTESASSVPIPLLILAGLALLLVAGGSAGYVIRRIQARRVPPSAA